eukprot:TRINITY_DN6018_c0_g1_i2.p1 TRINITY_DN6018_c0_g1~~TRINITY_DN6018_c0_g1_i2.p1  ORF type:complete len:419 (+),score=78.66 TRINITY_DN6018_c0_g1_i2:83-1339(+)
MIRRPPRSTLSSSSAASDVYKRQVSTQSTWDIKKILKNQKQKLTKQIAIEKMKQTAKPTPKLNQFGITKICLSPNKKMIACGINESNSVEIYEIGNPSTPNQWKLLYTLIEHTQRISALDWSTQDCIITGAYDRNVMVWSYEKESKQWKPSLVVIQQNKSAILDVSWDKAGRKFAIGTGGHKMFIAQYEQTNNWWIGEKCAEKLHSSILSVAMHPSGMVVAVGCADQQFCIVTCYQSDFDAKLQVQGPFADVKTFGTKIFQKENLGGWVNSVVFSESGNSFAFAVHNQDLYAGQISADGKQFPIVQVKCEQLPFTSLAFINDQELIATGFDYYPHVFEFNKDLKFKKTIQQNEFQVSGGFKKTQSVVQNMVNKQEKQLDENLNEHTTQILCCEVFQSQGTPIVITNDINGKIFFWTIK